MFKNLRNLFSDPLVRTLSGAPVACGLMATVCALGGAVELALGLIFLTAAAMGVLVFVSLTTYGRLAEEQKQALLHNWLAQAGSDEEREERAALLATNPGAAWSQASQATHVRGPMFNVDGTPMLPGNNMLDIHGALFGMPDVSGPVYNPATEVFSSPGSAYEPPLGS